MAQLVEAISVMKEVKKQVTHQHAQLPVVLHQNGLKAVPGSPSCNEGNRKREEARCD
jgi:hypothetical protein